MIACVWVWWLACKVGLDCYDDQMLYARHWASGCWLNAWIDASGLMAATWCVASRQSCQLCMVVLRGLFKGFVKLNRQ